MAHHNHAHHLHRRERAGNAHQEVRRQDTVVNVVYVTASPTFTGKIGGYKTMDGSEDDLPNPQPVPTPEPTTPTERPSPAAFAQSTQEVEQEPSTSVAPIPVAKTTQEPETTPTEEPTKASKPTEAAVTSDTVSSKAAVSSTLSTKVASKKGEQSESKTLSETLVPTHTKSSSPSYAANSGTIATDAQSAASTSAAASPNASESSSGGISGGAKAGLAIGILLAIGAVAALIFFCIRRRKTQRNEAYGKALDEKTPIRDEGAAGGLARSASVQTATTARTAPRLSLRPVTQFLPDLAAQRKSGGNLLAADAGAARHIAPSSKENDVEKAAAGKQASDPVNPFGNHAEISEKVPVQGQPNDPANPFGNHAETSRQLTDASAEPEVVPPAPLRIRTPTPEDRSAAAAGALAVGAVAARGHDAPKPLNLSPNRAASPAMNGDLDGGMPSPAGTEFSMTPASPGSFANGQPPSNVHRIQLDFKPSMDDELSLRAGQLVRLLHEYDDGWALCIRLDRSQQGVAPRTCLSARPVKPRPPPGARGPAPRGPPPPGMFPRPSSPASGRGSPSPYDQGPRANSPSPARVQRSMSPGPYGGGPQRPAVIPTPGKRRSNSASAVRERRNSPPGPSPMNPNVQRVPMQLQAVTAPGQVLSQSPPNSVPRKPVPGQAM